MCEAMAWKWTPKAEQVLAMIAAMNEIRRQGAYPTPAEEPVPAYRIQVADRPREPAYA